MAPSLRDLPPYKLNRSGDFHYDSKSYRKAVMYYKAAAEKGYPAAMQNLAWCYEWGHGVAPDAERSRRLTQDATKPILAAALKTHKIDNNKGICELILEYL